MYVIAKRFAFSAAHRLDNRPEEHQRARRHGHNYTVEVRLTAETLDRAGFVVDFGELELLERFIDAELDHRDLNDVLGFRIVTPSPSKVARRGAGGSPERRLRGRHSLPYLRIAVVSAHCHRDGFVGLRQ